VEARCVHDFLSSTPQKGKSKMSYTAEELLSIAERYPFLPQTIFLTKNHRCLKIALKNIEGNQQEVTRAVRRDMKDGTLAFRYGAPPIRQRRASADEIEAIQWRIVTALQSDTPAVPVISERERMQLQAIAAATL
jgi:hypothetical protein